MRLQNNVYPYEQIGLANQLGSLPLWIANILCPPHVALICNCCSVFFNVTHAQITPKWHAQMFIDFPLLCYPLDDNTYMLHQL
jgi:hypothetical protein